MKTLIFKKVIGMAIGLTVLIGAAIPATAQVSYLRAKIPFAFVAGKSSLPAGEYTMQMDPRTRVLQIQPAAANATYSVMLSPGGDERKGGRADTGTLRFEKAGGQYYMAEVWRPAQDFGNKLAVPKAVERARGNSGAVSTVDITVR